MYVQWILESWACVSHFATAVPFHTLCFRAVSRARARMRMEEDEKALHSHGNPDIQLISA